MKKYDMRIVASVFGAMALVAAICVVVWSGGKQADEVLGSEVKTMEVIPRLSLPRAASEYPEGVIYETADNLETYASELPSEAMVYKFVDQMLTVEDAERIAQKMGLAGDPIAGSAGSFMLGGGEARMSIDPESGEWSWIEGNRMWISPPKDQSTIPGPDVARRVAEEELLRLGLNWEGVEFDHVADATVSSLGSEPEALANPENDVRVVSRQVFFRRAVDGVRVVGPCRIVVGVGAGGRIVGVINAMKQYIPFEVRSLIPYETALANVMAGFSQTNIVSDAVSARVAKVQLALYEGACSIEEQPFLQPVYVFHGTSTDTSGAEEPFTAVVPALVDQ